MKKKNYKCCGKSYMKIDETKFNKKCLICKKNNKNNKKLVCGCMCGPHQGKIYRQSTAYVEDFNNYIICCEDEFREIEIYWSERWADYYGGLI